MKLLSLDLIAYGKFTDYKIDFPEAKGICVIYGSNEAGKSTCLRALRNLLYGIPENTLDDFFHEGKQLRVGGTLLGQNGKKVSVIRRKGRKSTLLGLDGNSIPEEELQALLGGIDRETFVRVFGLSRDELVYGGRAIMEGKGGVGESLFNAGLGGVDLRRVLDNLDNEAFDLFKPTGTLPKLNAEAKTYKELKSQIRNLVLLPKEWEEVEGKVTKLKERSQQLADRIGQLSAKDDHLKRLKDALPLMAELRECENKRAELGEVKLLRKEFVIERRQTQMEKDQARSEERAAQKRIEEIDRELKTLLIPKDLLTQERTIKKLVEELGSVEKARKDLPRVEGQVFEARQDAKGILMELRPDLDLEAAGVLNLTVKEVERIRSLVEEHGPATIRRQNTADKVEEYARKLNSAQKTLIELPEARKTSELERAIALVRKKGDLDKSYVDARFEALNYREDTEAALKGLPLWSGTLEGLESLPLPPEGTVERFEKLFDTADEDLRKARQTLEETKGKINEVNTNLRTLKLVSEPPTEDELMTSRGHRDRGWTLVKSAWLEGKRDESAETAFSAESSLDLAYEISVQKADHLADRMRREAEQVAHKASLLAERTLLEERAEDLSGEIGKLEERRKDLEKDWASRWTPAGFVPLSPREMRGWMSGRKDLGRRAVEVRKLEGRVRNLAEEIKGSKEVLLTELVAVGELATSEEVSLESILLRAEELVQDAKDLRIKRDGLSKAIEEAQNGKIQAEEEEKKHEAALDQWQIEWKDTTNRFCVALPVSAATAFLDKCQALKKKLEDAEKNQNRIDGMMKDIQMFEKKVSEFVSRYTPELEDGNRDQTVRDLSDKVSKAKTDSALKSNLLAERASRLQDLNSAQETIRVKSEFLDSLRKEAGCKEDGDFPEAERRSETACSLDDRITELKKQILVLAAGRKIELFTGEVEEEDPDRVLRELAKVKTDLEEAQSELGDVQENLGASGERLRAMDGSSNAALAAQEAQGKLESLRENTQMYLRVRLAAKILRSEVEKYREKSQGPVLKRAGELFAPLTQRFFTGLEPDYEAGDEPVVVGVRESGEKVPLAGMSDGSQDQLYLALRLASLEHFMSGGTAMPLLVDDALINFDDHRARAALGLFGELSKTTQVIFFTHHQHMVQLAQETIDGSVLHVLDLLETTR